MEDYNAFFEQATIQEAYVGKTDTLLEIEKQFSVIKHNLRRGQDVNSRPEVQKLNRLVERQFGMDVFSLNIDQKSEHDAYTIVLASRFDVGLENDMSKLVTGSQESGYKFKANNNFCIMVYISLGLIQDLSGEQLTAVILHEIGHNFAECLDNSIKIATRKYTNTFYNYLVWKAAKIFGFKYKKAIEKNTNEYARKESSKNQKKNFVRGWIRGLASVKYNFKQFCSGIFTRLACAKYKPANMSKHQSEEEENNIKKNIDRKNEVFADKFAAVYGYGVALAKGLYSMDIHQTAAAKFIDKFFSSSINDNFEALIQNYFLTDPHPHTIQRANACIHTLKSELEKEDLDPKMKQVIKEQISQLERLVQEITTATKNDSEREAVRKAFYKTVNENSPDALAEELEKEIEKELDEGLKKSS